MRTARFDFSDKGVPNANNVRSVGRKIDDSVYIWRLCTCSVKDVTLLLGTVER